MRALPGKSSRLPPGPQPVTRDAAPAHQRRRILRAAADLMSEHGFQGTSTEAIIRRARVGYGTFYNHFEGKEACLLALFDRTAERMEKRLWAVYEDRSGPWPQKIAAVITALFEEIQADPAVARVCLVESMVAGRTAVARYASAVKRFEPFFEPGRELSIRGGRLPKTLEGTLASGVLWIAHQRLKHDELERLAALQPETIEFVLRPYIGPEQAGRTADELANSLARAPA